MGVWLGMVWILHFNRQLRQEPCLYEGKGKVAAQEPPLF
jgi:hypothetical protein